MRRFSLQQVNLHLSLLWNLNRVTPSASHRITWTSSLICDGIWKSNFTGTPFSALLGLVVRCSLKHANKRRCLTYAHSFVFTPTSNKLMATKAIQVHPLSNSDFFFFFCYCAFQCQNYCRNFGVILFMDAWKIQTFQTSRLLAIYFGFHLFDRVFKNRWIWGCNILVHVSIRRQVYCYDDILR
jgi:hypothetical protein